MPVVFDPAATPAVIRLEGEVDIADAARLKEVLVEALGKGRTARISLKRATGLDVTAVQLLWAAARAARAAGVGVALEEPAPEALRAALQAAGFERFPFADGGASGGEG